MSDEITTETVETNPGLEPVSVYYLVHNADGQILRHGICAIDAVSLQAGGDTVMTIDQSLVTADFDAAYYVSGSSLLAKQEIVAQGAYSIAADGVASVMFDLPVGTKVEFQAQMYDADNTFEFATDTPDEYVFFFWTPISHRNKQVVIHAV